MDPSMKNDGLSGLLREQNRNPKKQCSSCSDDATTSYVSSHSSGKMLFGVDLSKDSPSVRQNGTLDSEKDSLSTMISEQKLLYHVDPLSLGSIASGKPWCGKQAIFPKGFRSRVKFLDARNPEITSSYICEILNGGLVGPLFKASLEECPDTRFVCSSAQKCWEMISHIVFEELTTKSNPGRQDLPPLQPDTESINGLGMFWLIQSIEALDTNHQCLESWNKKLKLKDEYVNVKGPSGSSDSTVDMTRPSVVK